jgi:hypothetical protein
MFPGLHPAWMPEGGCKGENNIISRCESEETRDENDLHENDYNLQ